LGDLLAADGQELGLPPLGIDELVQLPPDFRRRQQPFFLDMALEPIVGDALEGAYLGD
jgi:hypothetical protein